MNSWVGFDLDGCLAHYDEWRGIDHIGKPIKPMVDRVKKLLAEGKEVRIVTARVSDKDARDVEQARRAVQKWCVEHIGQSLEVTNEKDYGMVVLYDDRCVQVETNTGRILGVEHGADS